MRFAGALVFAAPYISAASAASSEGVLWVGSSGTSSAILAPGVPNNPLEHMNTLRKRQEICFNDNYCWSPDVSDMINAMRSQGDVSWTVQGGDYQTIFCSSPNNCLIKGKAVDGATSATATFNLIAEAIEACVYNCRTFESTPSDWVHCTEQIGSNPHFDVTALGSFLDSGAQAAASWVHVGDLPPADVKELEKCVREPVNALSQLPGLLSKPGVEKLSANE
ncbi:hypothetical protein Dda_6376 [Drechslerella dactyloides]|uniref:Uncharacterized protein n=1 Tax=Drechslerella dactyloides TaxID=74499 RepID=A0AAD6ITX3_DREDA|nr:hypothetical protein Dda_6376 [Drechslerella dactyloides]